MALYCIPHISRGHQVLWASQDARTTTQAHSVKHEEYHPQDCSVPSISDQPTTIGTNHHLEQKWSVVCTLLRRVGTVVLEPLDREEKVKHVKIALTANGYKKWAFDIPKKREKVEDISPRMRQLLRSSQSASRTFLEYLNNSKRCSDHTESPLTTNLLTLLGSHW